jgi:hypothetical protein
MNDDLKRLEDKIDAIAMMLAQIFDMIEDQDDYDDADLQYKDRDQNQPL